MIFRKRISVFEPGSGAVFLVLMRDAQSAQFVADPVGGRRSPFRLASARMRRSICMSPSRRAVRGPFFTHAEQVEEEQREETAQRCRGRPR